MSYIDGFIAPVFAGRKEEYLAVARAMSKVLLEHGALRIVETFGDDVPEGERTDLWRAVAADKAGGEGLVFSWIVWPSKVAREAGWNSAMADERMKSLTDMPFDGKRMIFGGFELLFDSDATAGDA